MFGESDSESPRLSSPWEAFSTSPSPCPGLASSLSSSASSPDIEAELARRLQTEVPRLVPEVEEGNVEYKLKLTPSPERLTRLITQLKWRLLEGGGQALYEIGVGDGGQLVGLPRHEMEGSLDTLEKMAGELGATVVILREIAVPHGVGPHVGSEEADARLLATPDIARSTYASISAGSGDDELEAFSLELDTEDSKPVGKKAEHKKMRRAVKRSVNAAFATQSRLPPVVVDASLADLDVAVPFEPTQQVPKLACDPDEVIIVEALVVRKLALEEAFLDFDYQAAPDLTFLFFDYATDAYKLSKRHLVPCGQRPQHDAPRRISYVIPAPQTPPPQLELPAVGVPETDRHLLSLFPPTLSLRMIHMMHMNRPGAHRDPPIHSTACHGRDGLVAAWELGVPMKRRSAREKDRKRHWEALTGWDEADDSSDDEDEEDAIGKPPRRNGSAAGRRERLGIRG
ncbi:GTPase [Rhizoctonia solani]|uniref:GTPase n=1 Tax=Rhizoctonia solani TaxID=456999 RepID=A0A8H7I6E5_9AGAM|nr:GTPase [Rhizoctonia solani]